jgi:hypothetical protein
MLITFRQANDHLRLDIPLPDDPADDPVTDDDFAEIDDDRVPNLRMKITQAEAIILGYLKLTGNPDDSPSPWDERERAQVQAATLLALEAIYDSDKERTLADYMAPQGAITLLLMRLRDPAMA